MKNLILLTILVSALFQFPNAQENFIATIAANNIEAEVQSNGALFFKFKNNALPGSDADVSTLKASGLWVTGLDVSGNVVGSIQISNDADRTDFQTNPNYQNIWKITNGEILAHKMDWADNNQIDNPQSAIFDWPKAINMYGQGLNSFWDDNQTGTYEPDQGDYPIYGMRNCPNEMIPNEMIFSAFNDQGIRAETNLPPVNIEAGLTTFAYDCTDSEIISNTIFVKYHIINMNVEFQTEVRFGIYNDFQIGCRHDDYIGSIPERAIQFAYNSDNIDCEDGFENNPPIHVVQLLRGPLAPKRYNEEDELVDPLPGEPADILVMTKPNVFIPFGHKESNSGMPQNGLEYRNIMKGKNNLGLTVENDGILYTGDPTNPDEWSERSENNIPSSRRTLTAFESFVYQPGAVNEIVVAHTIIGGGSTTVDEALQIMKNNTEVEDLFNNCFENGCEQLISSTKAIQVNQLDIYPNPASDQVFINHDKEIQSLNLYNIIGQAIPVDWNNNALDVSKVASGHYVIEIISDGLRYTEKLVVE